MKSSPTRRWLALAAFGVLAGCSHSAETLGTPLTSVTAVSVKELKPASGPVLLTGKMVEKCPVAGCWFMLRDSTGVIKVDTKAAGFTVINVPLNTTVTVQGTFKAGETDKSVKATGLTY